MIWVAENEAPELFSRLRYSAQESGTGKYTNNRWEYSKNTHAPAEIGLYLSQSPFTRPQKPKKRKIWNVNIRVFFEIKRFTELASTKRYRELGGVPTNEPYFLNANFVRRLIYI